MKLLFVSELRDLSLFCFLARVILLPNKNIPCMHMIIRNTQTFAFACCFLTLFCVSRSIER